MRCAIYTRKSTDEGLEQSFNSLDAQREACEAFIASQKHEGWVLDNTLYDDGGWSGGTLERPAVKQLLNSRALKRAARPASIIISCIIHDPPLMLLRGDKCLAGLALRIQRINTLF